MNQTVTRTESVQAAHQATGLRAAEKVALVFFTYALVASWFFPISSDERRAVLFLNLAAMGALVLLSRRAYAAGTGFLALRDWLPCALIVLAYRESGLFLTPDVSHQLDNLFIVWDRALLGSAWFQAAVSAGSPWLGRMMELAYLFVYPFIPLGFAAVYFRRGHSSRVAGGATLHASDSADRYWTAVLLAVLVSYALFPYFPLTPPRVLYPDLPAAGASALTAATGLGHAASGSFLRQLNYWVLDQYSVQACIFPSGHVAGAVATALAVRRQRPRLGVVFIVAAALITVSTVFGRYHYTADAAAGAAVGLVAFVASGWLIRPRPAAPVSTV